jgi:hypothetical protein
VLSMQGYWIVRIIIVFVFRKRIVLKSHLVLLQAWLEHFNKACNYGIFSFTRGITFKLLCVCVCVISFAVFGKQNWKDWSHRADRKKPSKEAKVRTGL